MDGRRVVMPRKREILEVMKGDANYEKASKAVDKARAQAVKELAKSEGGFAVFYVKLNKKGESTGIQTVMAGAMGIQDTMNMGMAMKEAADKMVMGMLDGMREQMDEE
jgi:hypothetical protein